LIEWKNDAKRLFSTVSHGAWTLNPQTIGKIDRHFGKPICWLLTIARSIGGLFPARPSKPVEKILFIKMIEQGATVLAYGALQTAVDRVGRRNVYFWVFEENRPILDLLDLIPPENVIVIRTSSALQLMLGMLGTLWRVRQMRFDASVDMEFFSRASAILAYLSGAKRRIGLHRFNGEGPYRGDLLTHRVQYNPYLHVAIQYHLLVETIWADAGQTPLLKVPAPALGSGQYDPSIFRATGDEITTVRAILEKLSRRAVDGPIFLINPNASDLLPLRKWDTGRFVALGQRLLEEDPAALLVVTGAPSEKDAAEQVARSIAADRCISIAGHTTLRQLMVLYTMADILVTNDSGPGHFSSMTPIDSVVLFGPETPALFGPLGPRTHVVWANLACSPCVNVINHRFSPCTNNVCMQEITVDAVHAKVTEVLHRRRVKARALQVIHLAAPISEAVSEGVPS
jgi:ADP-heptose:LPS heptosyltransferase